MSLDPKETTVQIGVHQADSRLLSEAIPGIQVAPRTSLILALSAILGLGLGITVVLIREALQIEPEDVDRYFEGLPEEHKHCAKLSVLALGSLIKNYRDDLEEANE